MCGYRHLTGLHLVEQLNPMAYPQRFSRSIQTLPAVLKT